MFKGIESQIYTEYYMLVFNTVSCLWRCSPSDGGEYKAVAKSRLGEATTFATVVVNCEYSFIVIFLPSDDCDVCQQ